MNFAYWIFTTYPFSAGAGYTFAMFKSLWPQINEETLIFKTSPLLNRPPKLAIVGPHNMDVFGQLQMEQGYYIMVEDFPDFRFAYLPQANRIYYYGRVD